jgi:hypothetical protein
MTISIQSESLQRDPQRACSRHAGMEPVVLDCDHALHHAGGDPELLVQLCYAFLAELPLRMEELHCAIGRRDYFLAGRALLRLQSCIVVFGAGHACLTAESLELAIRHRRFHPMRSEWKRLRAQLQLLVPQVQLLMLEMVTPRTLVQ